MLDFLFSTVGMVIATFILKVLWQLIFGRRFIIENQEGPVDPIDDINPNDLLTQYAGLLNSVGDSSICKIRQEL